MLRIFSLMLWATLCAAAHAMEWQHGQRLRIACDKMATEPVVGTALRMFEEDCRRVLGGRTEVAGADVPLADGDGDIVLHLDARRLKSRREAFRIEVRHGRLYVTGSDGHGLAYGLLEVSRLMGVSPWEWWADVVPRPLERFTLPEGYHREHSPSVQFRGIFINDEDWGLLPWATQPHEASSDTPMRGGEASFPSGTKQGRIGPETHRRIFELLLRLRANTFWPAMHDCSEPFFLTPGNREMAERYGIYIGTSHCEPMACNVNGEWRRRGRGDYDYTTNSTEVRRFWEERVKETADQPIIHTLGMRGVHDGAMQGARTVEEQRQVLERVLCDQREMLRRHVGSDLSRVPQVFIPYKEVLDVYKSGLEVPDDVCLMWCDDNYGYLRHFPTPEERRRKGGNGVYYHVSYWGRPHDYLWLGTFHPALLMQQMAQAYDHGMRRMWILNVGDLKPAEYQTQLFLDMAWDIDGVRRLGVEGHLSEFISQTVVKELSSEVDRPNAKNANGLTAERSDCSLTTDYRKTLTNLLLDHYRLAYPCKPEFLGGTRVEEADRMYWSTVRDLPWTWEEIDQRLEAYQRLEDDVERLWVTVAADRREAFFQLVKYPIQSAAEMNKKMLMAQRARHGRASWQESRAAQDSILALALVYNKGKWRGMMDPQPRRLPVFLPVEETLLPCDGEGLTSMYGSVIFQAHDASSGHFTPLAQLGYEGGAVAIKKGRSITFDLPDSLFIARSSVSVARTPVSSVGGLVRSDFLVVEVRLLPNHAIEGDSLRFRLSLDGHTMVPVNYETYSRSEEWKQNVLRNQARRRFRFPLSAGRKRHRLTLQALDEGIVLDQIVIKRI